MAFKFMLAVNSYSLHNTWSPLSLVFIAVLIKVEMILQSLEYEPISHAISLHSQKESYGFIKYIWLKFKNAGKFQTKSGKSRAVEINIRRKMSDKQREIVIKLHAYINSRNLLSKLHKIIFLYTFW